MDSESDNWYQEGYEAGTRDINKEKQALHKEVEKWRSIAQELVGALSETVDYIGEGEDITETIAAVKAIKRFNENW